MFNLAYKIVVLGVLPCAVYELKEITAHLLGPSKGSWKIEEDGSLVTVMSFASPQDREKFAACLEALTNLNNEADDT